MWLLIIKYIFQGSGVPVRFAALVFFEEFNGASRDQTPSARD